MKYIIEILMTALGIGLAVGSVWINILKNKLKKEEKKHEEELENYRENTAHVLAENEKMETGNDSADFDASIELLHNLAHSPKNRH